MRAAIQLIERHRLFCHCMRHIHRSLVIFRPIGPEFLQVTEGQLSMRPRVCRFELDSLSIKATRLKYVKPAALAQMPIAEKKVIVGRQIVGRLARGAAPAEILEIPNQRRDYGNAHFGLDGENVYQSAIIAISPNTDIAVGLDQLGVNPQSIARSTHAASQHILRIQFAPHLNGCRCLSVIRKRGIMCDDDQRTEPRQLGDDVLSDAGRKIHLIVAIRCVRER